jgi:tetratricopeptide (TPR) repeat protein
MFKRIFVSASVLIAVSTLLLFAASERSEAQGAAYDEIHYNETGLRYFNEAFYELTPMGRKQEAGQRYEQAIDAYKQAIALNSAYVDAHRNLARVYYVQKRFSEAAQVYKKVNELNPGDIDAYVKLASAYAHLQMYAEAIEVLEKAKTFTIDEDVLRQLDAFIKKIE